MAKEQTKEEIVKKYYDKMVLENPNENWKKWEDSKEDLLFWEQVMDEYAKQQSIEYGDWLIKRLFPMFKEREDATDEQKSSLYNLFIIDQNKNA